MGRRAASVVGLYCGFFTALMTVGWVEDSRQGSTIAGRTIPFRTAVLTAKDNMLGRGQQCFVAVL